MSKFTAQEPSPVAAPPQSKKLAVISTSLLIAIIAGAALWFFGKDRTPAAAPTHIAQAQASSVQDAKFVPLGEDFMISLQHEGDDDHYLQTAITLKILQPELEAKIKAMLPEIRSKLTALLSNKKPSELLSADGKKQLAEEIIGETNAVLGLAGAPVAAAATRDSANTAAAASASAAPAETLASAGQTAGIVDVAFTSFIVQ